MESIKLLALGYLSTWVLLTPAHMSHTEMNRESVFLFRNNEMLIWHAYISSVEEGNTTHGENSHEHEKGSLSSHYLKLIKRVVVVSSHNHFQTLLWLLRYSYGIADLCLGLARLSDRAKACLLPRRLDLKPREWVCLVFFLSLLTPEYLKKTPVLVKYCDFTESQLQNHRMVEVGTVL